MLYGPHWHSHESNLFHTAGTMDNIHQDGSPNRRNTEAPQSIQADVYVHGKEHHKYVKDYHTMVTLALCLVSELYFQCTLPWWCPITDINVIEIKKIQASHMSTHPNPGQIFFRPVIYPLTHRVMHMDMTGFYGHVVAVQPKEA